MSETTNPLTLLVLSDIHFGKLSVSTDFALSDDPPPHIMSNPVSMKDNLIEVIKEEHIDAMLITGDLTSKARPSEFKECYNTIIEIADRIGIEKKNIFFSFGNHDVDWNISELSEHKETGAFKDKLYLEVAASVGNIFIRNLESKEKGPLPGSGVYCRDKYIIYVLNSGYHSTHNQEYNHGKLGGNQYEWLRDIINKYADASKWHILMLHHHPFKYSFPSLVEDISCLEEGSEILDIIGKSQIDIVCHGHRHHPKLFTELCNNWESPITFFCAGSLSVHEKHRNHGEIPNLFHLIDLKNRAENEAATGTVRSFEYFTMKGWIPAKYSELVPLDTNQSFGSIHIQKEKEKAAQDMIANLLSEQPETCVELPKHSELALSLKCMNLIDLNRLIQKIVKEEFGHKLMGRYPEDDIAIIRQD